MLNLGGDKARELACPLAIGRLQFQPVTKRHDFASFRAKPLFELDGHKWRTLEHYLKGSRFRKENPKHYLNFSLDSDSDLSKSAALLKDDKHKDIKPDADFGAREEKEREDAQYAKYSQNSYLADMLLNTRNAKLVQFRRGKPPITCDELMRVRHRLQREKVKK